MIIDLSRLKKSNKVPKDVKDNLDECLKKYKCLTYDEAEKSLGELDFKTYCYIWQNSVPRLSTLCQEYKI